MMGGVMGEKSTIPGFGDCFSFARMGQIAVDEFGKFFERLEIDHFGVRLE